MIRFMPRQKEPKNTFGAQLIAARQAKGMTQIQLAEAIGTTQRAISYYEAEGGNPDLDIMTKISKALDVSTDQLLGLSEAQEAFHPQLDSTDERRLWRRFRQLLNLPEKDRRAVLRMLDSLHRSTTTT